MPGTEHRDRRASWLRAVDGWSRLLSCTRVGAGLPSRSPGGSKLTDRALTPSHPGGRPPGRSPIPGAVQFTSETARLANRNAYLQRQQNPPAHVKIALEGLVRHRPAAEIAALIGHPTRSILRWQKVYADAYNAALEAFQDSARTAFLPYAPDAVETVRCVMAGPATPRDKLEAARTTLAYVYGRPESTGATEGPSQVTFVYTDASSHTQVNVQVNELVPIVADQDTIIDGDTPPR